MTLSRFFNLMRCRAALIAGVFLASLLAGLAMFSLRTEMFEVSMLLDVRQDILEAQGTAMMPAIMRQAIERSSLNGKIAKYAGLKETEPFPVFQAVVGYNSQLLKVYAFVPTDRVEATKNIFNAMVKVLNEDFPVENTVYFRKTAELRGEVARVRDLQKKVDINLRRSRFSPEQARLAGEFADLARGLCGALEAMEALRDGAQTLKAFDLRVMLPPAVSNTPAGPSRRQLLIAFALLGVFAGLAAALWTEERDSAGKHE
jgi:hypothetical protein